MTSVVEKIKDFWFKYSPRILSIFKSNKWEYTLDKSESSRIHVYSLFPEQIYNSIENIIEVTF
jgi:sulfur relay (sulfurtransferase) DsrC/TusE family protein